MASNAGYVKNEDSESRSEHFCTVIPSKADVVTFEEAMTLVGNGWYNYGLLAMLSMATLTMSLDMFGFSVVVTGASCDFQLDTTQKSIMMSMPFLGPIIMAYTWGYIADTQGRKKTLLIAMWVSFVVSTISAFSPNWITLAVLRFLSTSFCSCVQSASYPLLGESCSEKVRAKYIIIMTSLINFSFALYMSAGYVFLNMEFLIDLGFIQFLPWRLLTLALALPQGVMATWLMFFNESPKFLLNAGYESKAIEVLRDIWKRNGGKEGFPISKVILDEAGTLRSKDASLLTSLWEQTAPLFRLPLLWRSLQLYLLVGVFYSVSNGFFIWVPFLAEAFSKGMASPGEVQGLCSMIISAKNNSQSLPDTCSTKMETALFIAAVLQSSLTVAVNLSLSKLASKRKTMIILILLLSSLAGVLTASVPNNVAGFILYLILLFVALGNGLIFTYFVDLYPTSYRGMAACLGVMIARAFGLGGVNLVGTFVESHCQIAFYFSSVWLLFGVFVSCFLPPDNQKLVKKSNYS